MNNYYKHVYSLIKRFLLILLLFSGTRLLFFIFNYNYFSDLSFIETVRAFYHGLTFDISAICYFNVLFFVLHIIPGSFKNKTSYQRVLKILFFTINALILFSNIADIEYFKFTNKRTTFDIFSLVGLGNDAWILLPQFLKDYWYLLIVWLFCIFILWYFYPSFTKKEQSKSDKLNSKYLLYQSLLFLGISTFIFVGGRGSLELKPLRIISASKYVKPAFIPLVLNTPFSILRTSGKQDIQKKNYYSTSELKSLFTPLREPDKNSFKPDNVIIFILESFSSKYIGYLNNGVGMTPFLDSIMEKSLVCVNNYANGKKSIEALPAIISSLPTLMNNPFISSSFASNQINSIPGLLKTKSYHTSFFHGGTNGTMGFDKFARLAEFEHYYGRSEYNNEDHYDGSWGIYDEEFLQFFASKLDNFKKPFFTSFFTLSSHHPFPIPEKYKNIFNKHKNPLENSIEYTDFALERFFEVISKKEWYKNTLFVFTADHTAGNIDKNHKPDIATYAIPLFFYHPSDSNLVGIKTEISQQIDIMPSILDYLNYDQKYVSFGSSIFINNESRTAVNYLNQVYQITNSDYALNFNGVKTLGLYNISTDSDMKNNLVGENLIVEKELESKLKAIIQSYNNRLIENKLTIK